MKRRIAIFAAIGFIACLVAASISLAPDQIEGREQINQEYLDLHSNKPDVKMATIKVDGSVIENVKDFWYSIEKNEDLIVNGGIEVYGKNHDIDAWFLTTEPLEVQIIIQFGTDSWVQFDECYFTNMTSQPCYENPFTHTTNYEFEGTRVSIHY